MATMKDVARLADVSVATVSAVLSGSSYVSPPLKARVQSAVRELGYAPNAVASNLRKGTTSLLGLVVPDIANPFFTALIQAVQHRARDLGYALLLFESEQDVVRERGALRLMQMHRTAGAILCPVGLVEDYTTLAGEIGAMALVTVDCRLPGGASDAVMLDNRAAARIGTEHLLQNGHTRVGMIGGFRHLQPAEERFQGFAEALRKAGLPVDATLVREAGQGENDAFLACRGLLGSGEPPTALLVAGNQLLIGALRAIAASRLQCPKDLSVVSIDDVPWAAALTPPLTTVRLPIERIAEAALTGLVDRLPGTQVSAAPAVILPELIVRSSCVPPSIRR